MHGFFHWIQEAARWLLHFAREHPPESAFAIAFIVSFGESFAGLSFLVPGTTILIGLGAILRATDVTVWGFLPIWLAAAVGAILGDWISYWVGHRYKEHVLSVWPISHYRAQMDKALAFFGRWGVWGIFIGRFMGPFRATVPLVAGISQMAFWPFQIANVTSAILWSASLLLLGAVGWDAIKATWFWLGGWPSIAVGAAAILLAFLFRDRIKSAWRQLPR
jgi:membrane protein DedA with SNARE-associated domain